MRKFLVAIVLLLGILFVITRFTEFELIVATLQRGDWRFLALALVVLFMWLLNISASLNAIYHLLGLEEDRGHLLLLAMSANFLNVVAPTAGVSALTVFITSAQRRGYSPGRATIAGALYALFDHAGFISVLILGFIVLFRRNSLGWPEITAAAILLSIALSLAALLVLATRSAALLSRVLTFLVRGINRALFPILHRCYLSEERAGEFAVEAAEGIRSLPRKPESFILPFALALSNKALLISIFFLMFLAFKVTFSVGTLIAGWSIGYLFLIVSPTPSGIGIVEGILTLTLTTMWVPIEAATVIVLTYRAYTFWIPLLLGMIAFRQVTRAEAPALAEERPGSMV